MVAATVWLLSSAGQVAGPDAAWAMAARIEAAGANSDGARAVQA